MCLLCWDRTNKHICPRNLLNLGGTVRDTTPQIVRHRSQNANADKMRYSLGQSIIESPQSVFCVCACVCARNVCASDAGFCGILSAVPPILFGKHTNPQILIGCLHKWRFLVCVLVCVQFLRFHRRIYGKITRGRFLNQFYMLYTK